MGVVSSPNTFSGNERNFEVDRYEENKSTYLGMGVGKVSDRP